MIAGIARLIVVEAKGMILILNMAENESFPVTGGEADFVSVTYWSSECLCSLMLLHYESGTIFTDAAISKRFDWWTEVIDVCHRNPQVKCRALRLRVPLVIESPSNSDGLVEQPDRRFSSKGLTVSRYRRIDMLDQKGESFFASYFWRTLLPLGQLR